MPLSDKEREISTTMIKEIESNEGANGKISKYHGKTTFLSKQTSLAEAGIYTFHELSGYNFDIRVIQILKLYIPTTMPHVTPPLVKIIFLL